MAFFKEKDTIRKISILPPGPSKDHEMKTIYSINKIMGTDMYYNVFVDGILVEEQKRSLVSDFDDIKKYEKVDIAFKVRTIYVDAVTNEIKETFKYNCSQEAEADLKHKNFEFNAVSVNGTVKLTKSDIVVEVKK